MVCLYVKMKRFFTPVSAVFRTTWEMEKEHSPVDTRPLSWAVKLPSATVPFSFSQDYSASVGPFFSMFALAGHLFSSPCTLEFLEPCPRRPSPLSLLAVFSPLLFAACRPWCVTPLTQSSQDGAVRRDSNVTKFYFKDLGICIYLFESSQ